MCQIYDTDDDLVSLGTTGLVLYCKITCTSKNQLFLLRTDPDIEKTIASSFTNIHAMKFEEAEQM